MILYLRHFNLHLEQYENDGQFKIEEFWIALFNTNNLSFKVLATVSSLIKIKSYHLDDKEIFEPREEHYSCYKNYIKS